MTEQVAMLVRDIIREARAEFGPFGEADFEATSRYAAWVRMRILDRWYRFEPFGVATRCQLERVEVTAIWRDAQTPVTAFDALSFGRARLDTGVVVAGTPLESR